MLEREHDQIHGLVQVHEEAGHVGVGDGDGLAGLDLVDEQGNHAAAAAHHVAVPGAADGGAAPLRGHAGVGVNHVLHHSLGNAHGVDGVGGLVGGQADDPLDPGINGGVQHIVGADDVGLHRLHGEELAGRNLLQGGGMEDVVHAGHCVPDGLRVAHVADVELDLAGLFRVFGLQLMAHIVLLFFIAGENADLFQVGIQKMLEHSGTERTGATGDHKRFAVEGTDVCHKRAPLP